MSPRSFALILLLGVIILGHAEVKVSVGSDKTTLVNSVREPNWEHFIDESPLDPHDAISIIKNVYFNQYWDNDRRVYRPQMVLNTELEQTLVDLVASSSSNNNNNNNNNSSNNHRIDVPKFFTHGLTALQYLATTSNVDLTASVDIVESEKAAFSLGLVRYAEELKKDWHTAAERKLEKNIIENKVDLMNVYKEQTKNRYERAKARLEHKTSARRLLREEHENLLLEKFSSLTSNLTELSAIKINRLAKAFDEFEKKNEQVELDSISAANTAELDSIRDATTLGVDAIKYRALVEDEMETANFDLHLNMLTVQGETAIQGFELITTTFILHLQEYGSALFVDPVQLVYGLGALLAVMLSVMLAYESGLFLRTLIASWMSRRQIVQIHTRGDGSAFSQCVRSEDLYLASKEKTRLLNYMTRLRTSAHSKQPLPNLLLTGSPGVGKSIASAVVALEDSVDQPAVGIPVSVVNGGDLEALGRGSASYLRRIIENSTISDKGCIVVLDRVDGILQQRESGEGHSHARDCLCTLLYGIRECTEKLAVIMTTTLTINEIDTAILDRVDSTVLLTLPSADLRFQYVRDMSVRMLRPHMTGGQFLALEACSFESVCGTIINNNNSSGSSKATRPRARSRSSSSPRMGAMANNPVGGISINTNLDDYPNPNPNPNDDDEPEMTSPKNGRGRRTLTGATTTTTTVAAKVSSRGSNRSMSPENTHPHTPGGSRRRQNQDIDQELELGLGVGLADPASLLNTFGFDPDLCILHTIAYTQGRSYRELNKLVKNILNSVLATEHCKLTTGIWMTVLSTAGAPGHGDNDDFDSYSHT
jgi:hypothetical protein